MAKHSIRFCVLAAVLLAVAMPGCAKNDPKKNQDKAEKALERVLDSWTRGESPDKYAGADQAIQASDPDWKAGCRLLSFLTIESKQGTEGPGHVQCRVSLSLQDQKGKRFEKDVDYDVKMGDKTVIARVPH